jgi:hypothetical protein
MLGDFDFRETSDGSVHIRFRGRAVTVLAGAQAKTFLRRVAAATALEAQHLMARATGHFKHGNERTGKRSPRS